MVDSWVSQRSAQLDICFTTKPGHTNWVLIIHRQQRKNSASKPVLRTLHSVRTRIPKTMDTVVGSWTLAGRRSIPGCCHLGVELQMGPCILSVQTPTWLL